MRRPTVKECKTLFHAMMENDSKELEEIGFTSCEIYELQQFTMAMRYIMKDYLEMMNAIKKISK